MLSELADGYSDSQEEIEFQDINNDSEFSAGLEFDSNSGKAQVFTDAEIERKQNAFSMTKVGDENASRMLLASLSGR